MRRAFCALQRSGQPCSDKLDERRYLLQKIRRKLFQLRNDRFGNRPQRRHSAVKVRRCLLRFDNIAVYLSVSLRRVGIKPVQRFRNQRLPLLLRCASVQLRLKFIFRNARPIQSVGKPARNLSGFRRFVRGFRQVFDRQAVAEGRINARRNIRPRRKLLLVVRKLCKVCGGFGRLSVVAKNAVQLRIGVFRVLCRMSRRREAGFKFTHVFAGFACFFGKPEECRTRRRNRRTHSLASCADRLSCFADGFADVLPIHL